MPSAQANGIEICYEDTGPADAAPLLLVNGYTSQMISWDERLLDLFRESGFRVVCFDNRDVGLTTKTPGAAPKLVAGDSGLPKLDGPAPYTLADMASDGMALLEVLDIERPTSSACRWAG